MLIMKRIAEASPLEVSVIGGLLLPSALATDGSGRASVSEKLIEESRDVR
jgi:hypothetical protein